jgi:hypothetical protein
VVCLCVSHDSQNTQHCAGVFIAECRESGTDFCTLLWWTSGFVVLITHFNETSLGTITGSTSKNAMIFSTSSRDGDFEKEDVHIVVMTVNRLAFVALKIQITYSLVNLPPKKVYFSETYTVRRESVQKLYHMKFSRAFRYFKLTWICNYGNNFIHTLSFQRARN